MISGLDGTTDELKAANVHVTQVYLLFYNL